MDRLSHTLRLAAPLLALCLIVALAAVVVPGALSLVSGERSSHVGTATLGDGIDEFSYRLAPLMEAVRGSAYGFGALFMIATVALTVSLSVVFVHIARVVRGPGDVVGVMLHMRNRIRRRHAGQHLWGVIRDSESGRPLPFARVRLTDAYGIRVIARTVSDTSGRYGFGLSPTTTTDAGLSVSVLKNGYYFPSRKYMSGYAELYADPVGVSGAHERAGRVAHGLGNALSSMAFWTSVASVPLISATLPNVLAALFMGSLVVTVIARIAGFARST